VQWVDLSFPGNARQAASAGHAELTRGRKDRDGGCRVAEHVVKVELVDGLCQESEVVFVANRAQQGVGDAPGVGLEGRGVLSTGEEGRWGGGGALA
jgi:hypothetical protein